MICVHTLICNTPPYLLLSTLVLYAVGVAMLIFVVFGDGYLTANVYELLGFVPLVFMQV